MLLGAPGRSLLRARWSTSSAALCSSSPGNLDQGRQDRRLRRHHRRAAHAVGPFVYFMAAMIALTGVVHLFKMVFPPTRRATAGRPREGDSRHDRSADRPRPDDGARVPAHADRAGHGRGRHRRLRLHARLELGAGLRHGETKIYETGRNYTLSVVPLFILMGNFVTRAGMSQELFRTAYAFIGHLRGGLAMATIVRLRRLRRHLRLLDRHRRDLRQGRLPVDEEVRLLGPACRPARSPPAARSAS